MIDIKTYLGDSVYVSYDGYQIQLYLDNGFGPKHEIYLDTNTLINLELFLKQVGLKES